MDKVIVVVGGLVVAIAALVFLSFLLSWPVYMLWNGCLVGAVAGVSEVTWLQDSIQAVVRRLVAMEFKKV